MADFNENPEKYIERYSFEFETKFTELFKIRYGCSNFVPVNKVYNEYIKDPHHVHLNATKWTSLGEFVNHLKDGGRFNVKCEEI